MKTSDTKLASRGRQSPVEWPKGWGFDKIFIYFFYFLFVFFFFFLIIDSSFGYPLNFNLVTAFLYVAPKRRLKEKCNRFHVFFTTTYIF